MIVNDPMYFQPFKTLIDEVLEKCMILKGFYDFQNGDLINLSKKLSEDEDKTISHRTLRDYRYIYIGKSRFSVDSEKLDLLSQHIEYMDWNDFLFIQFGIKQKDSATTEWENLKRIVANIYQNEDFRSIKLGGISSSIASLHIKDFYIDLSYVDQSVMKDSTELSIREKDQFRRVQRESVFRVSERLSEPIIDGNERVILMGNPGAGKSVFSRLLCWNWSQDLNNKGNLYIHVVLRDVGFDSNSNRLLAYINGHYFDSANLTYTHKVLSQYAKKIIFVLDGYDELDYPKKIRLFECLKEITLNARFILFSRPYGLIDNPVYSDVSLEIVGFNQQSRMSYIDKVFDRISQIRNQPSDLLEVFNKNDILNDLSFNPLMMSYIVLICIREDGIRLLDGIFSSFELHEAFLSFKKNRYEIINSKESDFIPKLEDGFSFAFQLEMDQNYVYNSYDLLGSKKNICLGLNQIGVGRWQKKDDGHAWQFHFNSASLQEYLASRFLLTTCTSKAILALLENQFYWNMCKMIVGGLSVRGETKKLVEILGDIWKTYKKNGNETYHYLYWILIAECDERTVKKSVNTERIGDLYDVLYSAVESKWWKSILYEAANRLLRKLEPQKENELARLIVNGFRRKSSLISQKICGLLHFSSNINFLSHLIWMTQELLKDFNQLKNNTHDKKEDLVGKTLRIKGSIRSAMHILIEADYSTLIELKQSIYDLNRNIGPEFSKEYDTLNLQLIEDPLVVLKDCKTFIATSEQDDLSNRVRELGDLIIKCIRIFDHYVQYKKEARDLAIRSVDCFVKTTINNFDHEKYKAVSLLMKHPNIIGEDEKLTLLLAFDHNYSIIYEARVELETLTLAISKELNKFEENRKNVDKLYRIGALLKLQELGFRAYPIFSERLFSITRQLIVENEAMMSEILKAYLANDYDELDENPIAKWIEEVMALPEFNFEKKQLAQRFYEEKSINKAFVRKYCLPQILGRDPAFNDDETWEIVRFLIDENIDSIVDVIAILGNEDLYYFEQNLPQVEKTISMLCQRLDKEKFAANEYGSSRIFEVNRMTFYTCRLITQTGGINQNKLLFTLVSLYCLTPISEYFKAPENVQSELVEIIFAPLVLYHLSKDPRILDIIKSIDIYQSSEIVLEENGVAELVKIISWNDLISYKELFSDELFTSLMGFKKIIFVPRTIGVEEIIPLLTTQIN